MQFKIFTVLFFMTLMETICFSQTIGQTKRLSYVFNGFDYETQIPSLVFTDPVNGKSVSLSLNQILYLPDFYEGIEVEGLEDYIGKKLVIDMIYMKHLCNEGSYDYSCTGWAISGINLNGTPKSTRKITLPKVGRINDPDGYVNVRAQMNVKAEIVGVLEPENIEEECFYFYTCPDPNWVRVDFEYAGQYLNGYIHKSRVVFE